MTTAPLRIPSEVASQGGCMVLFGLPFLAFGGLAVALIASSSPVSVGALVAVSLFVLAGGWLVVAGVRKLLQAAKFAPVFLELAEPARIGGDLVGRVEAKFTLPPKQLRCVLECTVATQARRRGKGGGGTSSRQLYEAKFDVPGSEISTPAPGRASFPVRVSIPATCPPPGEGRDEMGRKTNIRWTLDCHADVDGVDFHGRFPFTPIA